VSNTKEMYGGYHFGLQVIYDVDIAKYVRRLIIFHVKCKFGSEYILGRNRD
jgi:hypothetical protein